MAPLRRPTLSLLPLLFTVLLSIAVSADTTSAGSKEGETEGYAAVVRDQFMGLNPRSGSRFLAAVGGKKGDVCDAGNAGTCERGDPGQRLRCCRSKCTDLLSSRANCGACGNRCGFGQLCCKGRCTTVAYDVKNCGGCGVQCQPRLRCTYGLCGYA